MTNREFEIGAHSHGEVIQAVSPSQLGQKGEMWAGRLSNRRYAHQSFNGEPELFAALLNERIRVERQDSRFLRLLSGVDLDIEAGRVSLIRDRRSQRPRKAWSIERFYDVEQLDSIRRLIGLEVSDQSEFYIADFVSPSGSGLLNPIFTKYPLARLNDRFDGLPRLLLGHGGEAYGAGLATNSSRGAFYSRADERQWTRGVSDRRLH